MRRLRRAPTTQLARAGERTLVPRADKPVPEVRFRATTLAGPARGRIEIDTGENLPRTQPLAEENVVPGAGLVALSIVPEADTAITFLPAERPSNIPMMIGGLVVVFGALGWTAYDFLLGQ